MKRSEINQALKNMEEMIRKCGFHLPPFCDFTPDEWKEKGHEYDEIRDNMLGWDITDYGLGNFKKIGFSLITLRNGNTHMDKYKKNICGKASLSGRRSVRNDAFPLDKNGRHHKPWRWKCSDPCL